MIYMQHQEMTVGGDHARNRIYGHKAYNSFEIILIFLLGRIPAKIGDLATIFRLFSTKSS